MTTAPSRRAVAIACNPATPAPRTSTFAGATVPAAVISIGKNRGSSFGREQRGLVARDGRLRRERVDRLRTRDPRDRLHRERRHALGAQALDAGLVGERREEADQHRVAPERVRLLLGRRRHLDDDVRVERGVDELRACFGVRLVGERRLVPGAALDRDVDAERLQLRHGFGNERDPAFAGSGLARDAHPHGG